jgi:nitrogen fixation protein FixH
MSARTRWVGVVVGLLAASLGAHVVLLVAAISDPSFAIVPDYEEKAADWDSVMAQRAASDRLGWRAAIDMSPGRMPGEAAVIVRVTDAEGAPVTGAGVAIEAFHNARAADVRTAALAESEPGTYAGRLRVARAGIWVLEVVVERGAERFAVTERRSIARGTISGAAQEGGRPWRR